ncbi:MAG: hypothetical protein WC547_02835 [Candidatus Omnitrophota bacterium]
MRIFIVSAFILSICLIAPPAFCHPPKDIAISIAGENIDITVIHTVSDPAEHYIKTVKVSLNGVLLIAQTFLQQTGNEQRARYTIPGLKKSDRVTVEADCSKFGSLVKDAQAG